MPPSLKTKSVGVGSPLSDQIKPLGFSAFPRNRGAPQFAPSDPTTLSSLLAGVLPSPPSKAAPSPHLPAGCTSPRGLEREFGLPKAVVGPDCSQSQWVHVLRRGARGRDVSQAVAKVVPAKGCEVARGLACNILQKLRTESGPTRSTHLL